MPVNYDDLPSRVRTQIDAQLGSATAPKRARARGGGGHWRCARCPERFTAWATAERHADETGHCRIELELLGGGCLMPWHVEKRGRQFCVIKDGDGHNEGCHPTRSEAEAHLRALYANEPKGKR